MLVALICNPRYSDQISSGCGKLIRMLVVGGGGCGKSRIIKKVLRPLCEHFFGKRTCVVTAPSNRAARGVNGKTAHTAAKIGSGSLRMNELRTNSKQQKALARVFVPSGALLNDEFSMFTAPLYHALSLRATYGRSDHHQLELSEYTEASQTFGGIPIVIDFGDELQLPPVPETAGLLAPLEGKSREHAAGVDIFSRKEYVYRLTTAKRFKDLVLVSILQKMRQPGGTTLTATEKEKLMATELAVDDEDMLQTQLKNTELWYQASYSWSVVSMAQTIRSRASAAAAKATLYMIQAEDHILDRPPTVRHEDATQALLRHANMNDTGRMPGIGLIHVGMKVRLTVTIEPPFAVVDSTGVVMAIDLHAEDAQHATDHGAVHLLKHFPAAVLVKLDVEDDGEDFELLPPEPCELHELAGPSRECQHCKWFKNYIIVKPQESRSFTVEVTTKAIAPNQHLTYKLKVKRWQIPLTVTSASTLHALQGTTAEPGMIFHWTFPRRLNKELRWLAVYVALSRVRALKELLSVGMGRTILEIIQGGPPEGLLTRFAALFSEKEEQTMQAIEKAMAELGWN